MQFGFTIIFVPDVAAAIDFYERAFDARRKVVTEAFGMLDTGAITLAFGAEANERRELDALGDGLPFRANRSDDITAGVQISFIAEDVQASFSRAIEAGATVVYAPKLMPWGQWVSRVRDLNGVLVSIVTAPRF